MVQWIVSLIVECAASMRCAAAVTALLDRLTGCFESVPHWSTGRLWLLRIGLAELNRPRSIADDWVWMIDHSIQVGQVKCLVILGIRLSELPVCRPLVHHDMELIDLVPMVEATKHTVAACLEAATAETGVPLAIIDDHGADLHGGVEIFRAAHPGVIEMLRHQAQGGLPAEGPAGAMTRCGRPSRRRPRRPNAPCSRRSWRHWCRRASGRRAAS